MPLPLLKILTECHDSFDGIFPPKVISKWYSFNVKRFLHLFGFWLGSWYETQRNDVKTAQ